MIFKLANKFNKILEKRRLKSQNKVQEETEE